MVVAVMSGISDDGRKQEAYCNSQLIARDYGTTYPFGRARQNEDMKDELECIGDGPFRLIHGN